METRAGEVLIPMLEKYDVTLVDDPEGLIQWCDFRVDVETCVDGQPHANKARQSA